MQLSPVAAAPPAATPPASLLGTLPREVQVARIGKGSVASEIDRSIRLRFEGTGPIAGRTVVPESRTAIELFKTPHGATLEKAVKAFASIVDAHQGNEDLKTITFLPDEHASKAVSILNYGNQAAAAGESLDQMIEPTPKDYRDAAKEFPGLSKTQLRTELRKVFASEGVKYLSKDEASQVMFSAAWNGGGHISIMPDVSREFLSTIGLYRIQPGDESQLTPVRARERWAKAAWHTAVHEVHHSISPMGPRGPEHTSVMEEAVPEVLSPADMRAAIQKAGADLSRIALPARDTKHEPVNWPAWNRGHLPKPPASEVATAEGRYTDGPTLLKELLGMAGIDRRTTEGKAATLSILQDKSASFVPRRVADAIAKEHDLSTAQTRDLADLIRKAAVGKATLGEIRDFVGA